MLRVENLCSPGKFCNVSFTVRAGGILGFAGLVGATAEIHRLPDDLACQSPALVAICCELPEVMSLSRRILVMREDNIAGELAPAECSQPGLLRFMAGVAARAA